MAYERKGIFRAVVLDSMEFRPEVGYVFRSRFYLDGGGE